MPIESRDFGQDLTHIFDETSLAAVMEGCDTVTDFIDYLTAREELYKTASRSGSTAGKRIYSQSSFTGDGNFPPELRGRGRLPGSVWREFTAKSEYRAKKEEDWVSYVWDRIIDHVADEALAGNLEFGGSLSEVEVGLRTMAKEDRFSRRLLAADYVDFLERSNEIESRMTVSPSGVAYVFRGRPSAISSR